MYWKLPIGVSNLRVRLVVTHVIAHTRSGIIP